MLIASNIVYRLHFARYEIAIYIRNGVNITRSTYTHIYSLHIESNLYHSDRSSTPPLPPYKTPFEIRSTCRPVLYRVLSCARLSVSAKKHPVTWATSKFVTACWSRRHDDDAVRVQHLTYSSKKKKKNKKTIYSKPHGS